VKRLPGQALGCLHWLARAVVAVALPLALGVAWLAWRLDQGPLPVPLLARQIERAVNLDGAGTRLTVREAAIAWEGWRSGGGTPLDIRLRGVRVVDPGGAVRAELPDAAATLALGPLLVGRVVPATIELRRPSVLVFRGADGQVGLDIGSLGGEAAPSPSSAPAPGSAGEGALQVLAALMQPASEHSSFSALRRIRLLGGEVTVVDQALGRTWALLDPNLDIRREAGGGLVLDGAATLRLGELTLQVRLSGQALGNPMRVTAGLTLPALLPRELAQAIPQLAPLAVVDAPLSLGAFVDFDASGMPHGIRARLTAGAGRLDVGRGRHLAFAGLEMTAAGDSQRVELREARLRLPGEGTRPGAELLATGQAQLAAGSWQAALETRLSPLPLAELRRAWPDWAAPGLRAEVLPRLTGGRLREASLKLALTLPESLDGVDWQQAEVRLALDQPELRLVPGEATPIENVELAALATPALLRLERLGVRLPGLPRGGGAIGEPTTFTADAEATRDATGWRVLAHAGLDMLDLSDLPLRWPLGVAPHPRAWLTENVTAGQASNGRWTIGARLPAALDDVVLSTLTGTIEASDVTVHWLRPVPPMVGASGTAEFGLTEITVRAQGARQTNPDGSRGNLVARDATVRFWGLDTEPGYMDLVSQVGGPLVELDALLHHPRLKLFEKRPLDLGVRGGQAEARLTIAMPLLNDMPMDQLRLRAAGRITDGRLQDVVLDKDLDRGALDLAVDTDSLKLSGEARLEGTPVRLSLDMDFRNGPATQVIERATVTARADASELAQWGLDPGRLLTGPLGLDVRYERRRGGQGSVTIGADLRQAVLAVVPIGWAKPAGTPGSAEVVLRLDRNQLTAVESFRVEALELALRGRASFGREARLERVELVETIFGGSRLSGDIRPPAQAGAPWSVALRGPLLDLRPIFGPSGHVAGGAAGPGRAEPAAERDGVSPPLALDLRFERVTMGEGRELANLAVRARSDAAGLLREARITGATGPNAGFEGTLVPRGDQRVLRLQAADGGALLRALDLVQPVQGGRLTVNAVYEELRPGAALVGTAELDGFVVRDAPSVGKILQAMTLYGLVDALGGPGLNFARAVVPFRLTPEALELTDARAFSASLGVTVKGRVLRERPGARTLLELEGTIVPAYMFNALLGNIPVLGRIFSPETGGGLFAATWRVQGPVDQAQVSMNPLAALTPGFLRGLFGIVEGPVGGRR
jgi:hypothetical protein